MAYSRAGEGHGLKGEEMSSSRDKSLGAPGGQKEWRTYPRISLEKEAVEGRESRFVLSTV